jgi:hypothetical protein
MAGPLLALPALGKFILPAVGAGIGAYSGYKQGGWGGAALGGVTGAVIPGVGRYAGTALGFSKLPIGMIKYAPALGSTLGWGLVGAGGDVAKGVYGKGQQNVGEYRPTQGLPAGGPMYGVTDYYNPLSSRNLGYGWQQKDFDINRQAAVDAALAMEPIIEGAKQREYQRNLAAAKYRQQVATEANLIQQGQLGAQAMGRIGAQTALGALAGNYQYR